MDQENVEYTPDAPGGTDDFYADGPTATDAPAPQLKKAKTSNLSHPIAILFYIGFRVLSILFYLIKIGDSFVFTFSLTVIFLTCDFWNTKNVAGRLLVGLRWWNEANAEGVTVWKFESVDKSNSKITISPVDAQVFWWVLFITPALWAFFIISNVLPPTSKLLIALIGFTLSGSNLLGYLRCRKDTKKQFRSFIAKGAAKGLEVAATSV
ncbi:protein of unknown function DUF846, eukaryotic [Kipferlia bialata]|uniref:Golgi apparatus membrane protein TVP23 homolog n=1 Tax=Kipferlia bialata TaxID=797122 RepID=A0A9K3D5A7_9EUKA|nr:protein of unknown function DUF846, eukaryotic [Kipferlia bialata]|eukprot:g10512.t1